jgi:hypothetical protein
VGQAGSPTKRARALTNFTAAAGSASITVAPTGTSTINFRISAIGQNSSKTFYIGADFPIADDASALVTGQADSSFYVWVAAAPSTPTGTVSGSGTATANVFRSLSLSQTATLTFGRLVRPLSGPGWVQLAASNGGRTSSGAFWMTLPSPTRAAYTATGEGGKVLSISVPSSFTMTGPNSGSVTVTTNNNVVATPTLSSIPGNNGTYSFFVGGKLDVTDATPGGLYSGAYQVTVSYN